MSAPLVPPRPARTNAPATSTKDSLLPDVPQRPTRKLDPSPIREMRSPLNELPNPTGPLPTKTAQNNSLTPEVPPRPSIQTIPSIGQEGTEYASFDTLPSDAHGARVDAPEQTRNVSASMPLHAPRASLAESTAKSRIETVTSTDSTQAAAAGIGKAKPKDDVHKAPADSVDSLSRVSTKAEDVKRVPSSDYHFRSSSGLNHSSPSLRPVSSRPGSMYNEGNHEQGIPEIGQQIPLNPMAGDVQAPSPAPTQSQFAPGIGFFNDGSARAHVRRKSSRQEFGPPDSFGLHSHGQQPHDQFERDWIAKHPREAAQENLNAYRAPIPETALSSADLNKLVDQIPDVGMGTNPNVIGTPGEEVAWGATDSYVKWSSPKPSPLPTTERRKRSSGDNQPVNFSPLRKATSYGFPNQGRASNDDALETEDDTIHVDPPERSWNKVTGGGAADGTLDLGPQGGNTEQRGGWYDEQGYGTPILASDEVMKRPGSAYMQPAVDPEAPDHHDYDSDQYDNSRGNSRRNSLRVPSRPSSRPNSMHGEYLGGNLHRFISHDEHQDSGMHTPLEGIEEYEPLIPEGEEESPKQKARPKKRPGLEHHQFPSQDVWEDTPSSLQYHTTVETPEPERNAIAPPPASKSAVFETPEQEQQRKAQNPDNMFSDNKTLLKPAVAEEMRPGMHRFPSRDIWEDTPDSMMGVTTVSSPQIEEARSPPEDRPTTTGQDEGDVRATTGFSHTRRPSIPARPLRKSKLAEEMKPEDVDEPPESTPKDISIAAAEQPPSPEKSKPPAIPDRPKPSVPARPARPSKDVQADGVELSKSISPEDGPPVNKPKPPVPARPAGGKVAALKAGFMDDLNNRLKLGPQGPPPKAKELESEVAEETTKAPLADARKGRAKGPARRKPAASPSAAAEETPAALSICSMVTIWEIDESNKLQVPANVANPDAPAETARDEPELAQEMAANEAHNTAEPTLGEPMSPEKATSPPPPEESYIEGLTTVDSLEQKIAQAQARVGADLDDQPSTVADVEEKELAPATSDAVDTENPVPATEHTVPEADKDTSVADHADVLEEHNAPETSKTMEESATA